MPWIVDESGEDVYRASMWVKEELPTWSELREWYECAYYTYTDQPDQKMDVYWKIPRSKYLLSVVCNQLNKLLYEDRLILPRNISDDDLGIHVKGNAESVSFGFIIDKTPAYNLSSQTPMIYSISHPRRLENPFITPYPRTDIRYANSMELQTIVHVEHSAYPIVFDANSSWQLIDRLIAPVKEYFRDEIGWKDVKKIVIPFDRAMDHAI